MATTVVVDISNKRWMSEKEASIYTTISRENLRFFRNTLQLPYRLFGRSIKYEKDDLDGFMEKLEKHQRGRVRKARLVMPEKEK